MARAKPHKSQHFVPRTYLAGWCDPDTKPLMEPYVWLFERNQREGRRKAPKNTFEETDFYTIQAPDGTRDLLLEKGLSELESRFADIRENKLAPKKALTDAEQIYLAAFFVAMTFRTKSHRDFQREQWGDVKELMDQMNKQYGKASPEERHALEKASVAHDPKAPSLSSEQVNALAATPIQRLLRTQMTTYLPVIGRMKMLVFTTSDDLGFITSDDPCVWTDPDAYKRPPMYRQPRLMSRDIELSMPLSPTQLLVLNWGLAGYMPAGNPILDEYNRRTRFNAYEYYIARRNVTRDAWFDPGVEPEDSWDKKAVREKADEKRDDDGEA